MYNRSSGQIFGNYTSANEVVPFVSPAVAADAQARAAAERARQKAQAMLDAQREQERLAAEAAREELQRRLDAQRKHEAALIAHADAQRRLLGVAPWQGAPYVNASLGAAGQVPPIGPPLAVPVTGNLTPVRMSCAEWTAMLPGARRALVSAYMPGATGRAAGNREREIASRVAENDAMCRSGAKTVVVGTTFESIMNQAAIRGSLSNPVAVPANMSGHTYYGPFGSVAVKPGGQVRPDPMKRTVIVPPVDPYATARVATNPSSPSVRAMTDATVTQTALTAMQLTCAQWLALPPAVRLARVRMILAGQMPPPAEQYTPGSMTTTMTPGTPALPGGPGLPCIAGLPALPGFPPCVPGEPGKPGDRPNDISGTIVRAQQAAQRYIIAREAMRQLMAQGGTPEEVVASIDRHCARPERTSTDGIWTCDMYVHGRVCCNHSTVPPTCVTYLLRPGGLAATELTAPPILADANATLATLAATETDLATRRVELDAQCKRSTALLGATVLVGVAGVLAYALKKP